MAESADTSGRSFRFVTTVDAAVDARALLSPLLNRVDLIVYVLALLIGLWAWAATGDLFGLVMVIIAVMFIATRHRRPLQRMFIARTRRSLVGKETEVTVSADGFQFSNEVASAYVPWSSVTAVRSNTRTVLFLMNRDIAGYIPASAFSSPSQKANLVQFAQERIAEKAGVREVGT